MLSNAYFLANFVLIQPRTSPPKICKIFENAFFVNAFFENAFFENAFFENAKVQGELADHRSALGPAAEEDPRVVPAQSRGLLVDDREHAIDGSLHLGDDRAVKIKSLEAAKIMKIKWLVLGWMGEIFDVQ